MKHLANCLKKAVLTALVLSPLATFAQQPKIQNLRAYDQSGINVFETPKETNVPFDGVKVRFGAGFNQAFQSLKHSNTAGSPALYPRLAPGFAVAQANLYTDVQLADGIRLNLTTYLSARHHNEAWVKGGYMQFDKLPFKGEVWNKIMNVTTIKVGHMEINYGDQHYRRTDGGHAVYNPFIENYIMDAFATEVAGEIYVQKNGLLGMIALSNGLINGGHQEPIYTGTTTFKRKASVYGKLAFDKQIQEKVRVRVAGSFYHNNSDGRSTLYGGDRTGSNYFFVMESATANAKDNPFSGRVNPNFANQITALQLNLFAKVYAFEFFGTFENAKGRTNAEKLANFDKRSVNQLAVDAVLRIGAQEKVFLGMRYNQLKGQLLASNSTKQTVNRFAVGGGWFVTKNILMKAEYVNQDYKDYPTGNILNGGNFKGVVINAAVGF
jgi:hypothetical protein